MPKPRRRLAAPLRKAAIAHAVLPLLARRGFDGVTTRELAAAAGVSEALLFRHFPTKENLNAEIYEFCTHSFEIDYERVKSLTPDTATLVRLVYFLVRSIVVKRPQESDTSLRLLYRSLIEDTRFVRKVFTAGKLTSFRRQFEAAFAAAVTAGDCQPPTTAPSNLFWFTHHSASMICLVRLAEQPVIAYRGGLGALINEVTRFTLRGLGLAPAVIDRWATDRQFAAWLADPELTLLAQL